LQQLDGLHQLRRHHQGLALADLQSLGQRHLLLVLLENWSDSCFSPCIRDRLLHRQRIRLRIKVQARA
jgi:hypothetical protein